MNSDEVSLLARAWRLIARVGAASGAGWRSQGAGWQEEAQAWAKDYSDKNPPASRERLERRRGLVSRRAGFRYNDRRQAAPVDWLPAQADSPLSWQAANQVADRRHNDGRRTNFGVAEGGHLTGLRRQADREIFDAIMRGGYK
jgi:hypothetical protein